MRQRVCCGQVTGEGAAEGEDAQKEVLKKLKIEKPVESRFLLREYFQGGELGRFTSTRWRKV